MQGRCSLARFMDGSQGMRGRVGSRQICKARMLRFEKIASHSLSGLFNNIQDLTLIRHIDCWHWRWLSWWCWWGCWWWGWSWWWRGSAVEAVGQALLPLLHDIEDQTWFNLEQFMQWIYGNNRKTRNQACKAEECKVCASSQVQSSWINIHLVAQVLPGFLPG